ncbi:MAG: hypothetical protein OJF51_000907 [Nitrospira sp.]|nr:MAG: hypothetical protein OJF51_000907 [Nitrospira sp.]
MNAPNKALHRTGLTPTCGAKPAGELRCRVLRRSYRATYDQLRSRKYTVHMMGQPLSIFLRSDD